MEYTEEEMLLLEILDDEDVIWDWNLWKSDDPLVQWLVAEKLARCESLDILGYNEETLS